MSVPAKTFLCCRVCVCVCVFIHLNTLYLFVCSQRILFYSLYNPQNFLSPTSSALKMVTMPSEDSKLIGKYIMNLIYIIWLSTNKRWINHFISRVPLFVWIMQELKWREFNIRNKFVRTNSPGRFFTVQNKWYLIGVFMFCTLEVDRMHNIIRKCSKL